MDFQKLIKYLNGLYETYRKDKQFFNDSQIKAIEENTKAIQEKEITEEVEISNTEDIVNPLVDAQNATIEAIKAIPRVDIPEIDLSSLEVKLEDLKSSIEKLDLSVNIGETRVDTKGIIKAIEKMEKNMPKMEKQEIIDYTIMFSEMMDIMERPKDHSEIIKLQELVKRLGTSEDLGAIAEWLKVIAEKEQIEPQELPIKDGRLLVSVDKVGGGGGGGLTSIQEETLNGLATEATQKAIAGLVKVPHDEKIIDETNPDYVTITYKNEGVTVAVKTIQISGAITAIKV